MTHAVQHDGDGAVSVHRLRKLLRALCEPITRFPKAMWLTTARLERIDAMSLTGEAKVCWRVAGTNTPAPTVSNESELMRTLVVRTEAALGRPVSRPEVAWYMEHVLAHGTAEERALCDAMPTPRLDYHLAAMIQQRARIGNVDGRLTLRRLDPPALQAGPHRARFTFGAPNAPRSPIMDVEHAADVLQLAVEAESLRALDARVDWYDDDPIGAVVRALRDARLVAIRRALRVVLPYDRESVQTAAAQAMTSATKMGAWLQAPPVRLGTTGAANVAARVGTARKRHTDITALDGLLERVREGVLAYTETVAVLGEAAVLTHDETRTFVDQIAAAVNPMIPMERLTYVSSARRLAVPDPETARTRVMIDRVDVAMLCARADDQPRAFTLVSAAHALLGHVLRDAAHLAQVLRQHPHADAGDRRALVVACALLGHVVPPDLAVPDPRDLLDTRAYLLACALGSPEQAVALIDAADRRAAGPVREVTDTALGRAESGALLAVVG